MASDAAETPTGIDLEPLLRGLLAALCCGAHDLCAEPAAQILVVFASARGEARASVRGLCNARARAQVELAGGPAYYELSLRPRWFLDSAPRRRLESLIHELWHVGAGREGVLDPRRGHTPKADAELRRRMPALIAGALESLNAAHLRWLALDGEVHLPSWLRRPLLTGEPGSGGRFSDGDLYRQSMHMRTPVELRERWHTELCADPGAAT